MGEDGDLVTRFERAAAGVVGGCCAFTLAAGLFAAGDASAGTVGATVGALRPVPAPVVERPRAPVPTDTRPVFVARRAESPCTATTRQYRAAQQALADGDINSADDLAILAAALIAECGWTPVDTALGDRR